MLHQAQRVLHASHTASAAAAAQQQLCVVMGRQNTWSSSRRWLVAHWLCCVVLEGCAAGADASRQSAVTASDCLLLPACW